MTLEYTRIIASKYDGQDFQQSQIVDVTGSSNSTITLTIPPGYYFYLTHYGGNVPAANIQITVRNRENQSLISFTQFPDFFQMFEYLTFIKQGFKDNVNAFIENDNNTTKTVTFLIKGLLIPEGKRLDFEKEVCDIINIPKILRGAM